MCIVFSIIEHVYRYLRVTLSSMFVVESSYVSFLGFSLLCIHFVTYFVRKWDEWPFPKGFRSLSFPSLHSLLMWLHFMFDLSWSSLILVFCVSSSSSLSLLIRHFHFTSYSFLTTTHFRVWYSLCIIITHLIINSICFICLLIDIIFTLGSLRSMDHRIFYTCCISYMRAWVMFIGYLGLVSLHLYHPITLAYIASCVLRPFWGHETKCSLLQLLLGQVFEI